MRSKAVERTIAELCSEVVDCPHSTPKWTPDGVVVLRSKNIRNGRLDLAAQRAFTDEAHYQDRVKRAVPQGGDLVITREAPMGEVCMLPPDLRCCLGQRMVLLRPDPAMVDGRYLLYSLQSPQVQHDIRIHEGTGSTVSNLRIPALKALRIPAPKISEQRRVATVLGALDDKIELNRKMNRALEEIAQTIFKSWFIDFDGTPESDLVESELGAIPKNWEVTSLRDHITLDKGLSYKGKFLTESGVPMVNLKCVRPHGGFRRDATKPYSGDFKPRHVVHPGDLIIANTDLTQARDILGCPAFVPNIADAETVITSHHTFAVRFHDDARVKRHYLYHLLLSPIARRRCRGFATGTTVLAVPRDALLDFEFALPPAEQLMEFEHIARVIRDRIETSVDESETLARTRDTLLPKLLSGELRMPETEEAVEATA